MFNQPEEKVTKETKSILEKIDAERQKVLDAFRRREPKLTVDEKKVISELEARIQYLAPVNQKLEKLLAEKDARLQFLERNMTTMLIDGADLDPLVSELVLLKPTLQILSQAFHDAMLENSTAGEKIKTIKEKARERELREDA